MTRTPAPKLDRSLPGSGPSRQVKWGAWTLGFFGAVGTLLTLFFGLVDISPLWDLTAEEPGPQIYVDTDDYRIKHLPPTTDQLYFDYSGTRALLEGYLELRRTPCTLQALDENYGALEANEQRNLEGLSHLKTVHGQTLMQRGSVDAAVEYFEEARRLSPKNSWAVVGLHWARTEQLRRLRAEENWNDEQEKQVKELLDMLEALSRDLSELSIERLAALELTPGDARRSAAWRAAVLDGLLRPTSWEEGTKGVRADEPSEVIDHPVTWSPDLRTAKVALILRPADAKGPQLANAVDGALGISPSPGLLYVERDTDRLAQSLERLGYRSTVVDGGGRARVLSSLLKLVHASRETDQVIVYYSGHGFTDKFGNGVLTLDGGAAGDHGTGHGDAPNLLAVSEVTTVLSHHRGKVLVVLDACRDARPTVAVDLGNLEDRIGPNPPTVIYSSGPGRPSIESSTLKSGVFTAALERYLASHFNRLQGLIGHAEPDDCGDCPGRFACGLPVAACTVDGDGDGAALREIDTACGTAAMAGQRNDFEPAKVAATLYNMLFGGNRAFDGNRAFGGELDAEINSCRKDGRQAGARLRLELDLVAAFDEIAATTTRLAEELHGVEQVPELKRPGSPAQAAADSRH